MICCNYVGSGDYVLALVTICWLWWLCVGSGDYMLALVTICWPWWLYVGSGNYMLALVAILGPIRKYLNTTVLGRRFLSISCIMYESCMYHVCIMYASCMHHVCIMYASCMHHVWIMYASCLYHVCIMEGPLPWFIFLVPLITWLRNQIIICIYYSVFVWQKLFTWNSL